MVLGRASSYLAKELLTKSDEIVIVNAEKAVVSGRRRYNIERYKMERDVGSVRKGPRFPKEADRIFRRTVRGMLPMKDTKGIEALKRLRVYIGIPMEFKGKDVEKLEEYQNKHVANVTTLYEICKELGSKVIVDGD
ncbi:MAG: 50S ribosomal protein L13 [Candidatus Thermoplasmatota archaeon]|nr:50S ribosomal protein L13 [Candidatus Thermoplasmatota archaeon]MCL6002598.1 50S ribosomal protein L13 [Candidatus Thermoplasmatota archaeon]